MALTPTPNSEQIAGYDYDPVTKALRVRFRQRGVPAPAVYTYHDVPNEVYDGLEAAESKEAYIRANPVRSAYRYSKAPVTQADEAAATA